MTSNPYVREVAQVPTLDGYSMTVGVDHDVISLGGHYRLTQTQAEEFAHALVTACWAAATNQVHMLMDEAISDE